MVDFLGKELLLNDRVVFVLRGYREFRIGTIVRFTEQNVRIAYGRSSQDEILQSPKQVIKIEKIN